MISASEPGMEGVCAGRIADLGEHTPPPILGVFLAQRLQGLGTLAHPVSRALR